MHTFRSMIIIGLIGLNACTMPDSKSDGDPFIPEALVVAMDRDGATLDVNNIQKFSRMMYTNFNYPDSALLAEVGGEVRVQFTVTPKGRIHHIQFLNTPLGHGIESEVMRVLLLSDGLWSPLDPNADNHAIELTTKLDFEVP